MKRPPRHFVTTWPRKTNCPKCQRTILDGIDQGLPYRIDPIPLTLTGELAAQLAGRTTYRLLANHITTRTPENITAEVPDTSPPIYARHQCLSPNPQHIAVEHIPETQQLLTDKYLEKATPEQDTTQQALITITDALNGHITQSPDDEEPPF